MTIKIKLKEQTRINKLKPILLTQLGTFEKLIIKKIKRRIISISKNLSTTMVVKADEKGIPDALFIRNGLATSPVLKGKIVMANKPTEVMGKRILWLIGLKLLKITPHLRERINIEIRANTIAKGK